MKRKVEEIAREISGKCLVCGNRHVQTYGSPGEAVCAFCYFFDLETVADEITEESFILVSCRLDPKMFPIPNLFWPS